MSDIWEPFTRQATGRPFQIFCYVTRRDTGEIRRACARGYHMSRLATKSRPRVFGTLRAHACASRVSAKMNGVPR